MDTNADQLVILAVLLPLSSNTAPKYSLRNQCELLERLLTVKYSTLFMLVIVVFVHAFPFKIGPSIRYVIPGSGILREAESVSYNRSILGVLFSDTQLFVLGFGMDAEIADDLSISFDGYWRHYDPKYVSPPDSAGFYFLDRTGSITIFTLGIRKTFGEFYAGAGAEAHYFKENWTNPFEGGNESIDSLSMGPSINIGTMFDITPGLIKYEMGLIFPNFSDVWGKFSLAVLFP